MAKGKELATQFDNPFLGDGEVLELLKANLGAGASLSISDLDRVRVPNGTTSFEIPDLEQGERTEKEISGVILHVATRRSFWPTKYTGGNEPPQCYSNDGLVGIGDPGGACASCPMAEYESASKYVEGSDSDGQACKESRVVFLLTEDTFLPRVLQIPPTGLKAMKSYMIALLGRRLKYSDVITRFTVEKDKNANGLEYSKVVPSFGGRMTDEVKKQVQTLAEEIVPRINIAVASMEPEDVVVEEA